MICPSNIRSHIINPPAHLKRGHSSLLFAPQINTTPLIRIESETYPVTYNHFVKHSSSDDPIRLRVIMNIKRLNFILCISGALRVIKRDRLIFDNGDIVYFHELLSNVYSCRTRRVLTSTDVKESGICVQM